MQIMSFINDINKTYCLLAINVRYGTAESNNIIVLLKQIKKDILLI
jgi:hypothetical protein